MKIFNIFNLQLNSSFWINLIFKTYIYFKIVKINRLIIYLLLYWIFKLFN